MLTQSLCRRGQVRTATTLLDEMLHRGIPADPLAYTTVLNALCRKKQLREAYRLLCLMRGRGVSPDIVHYNTVIVGMCREGRPLDACKVIGDMTDSGCIPNAASYAAVVNGLCVSGLFAKAETYLEDMVGKGIVPPLLKTNDAVQNVDHEDLLHSNRNNMDQVRQKMNCKWHPPVPGAVKLNVDAAFKATDDQGAIGVVISDENGRAAIWCWGSDEPGREQYRDLKGKRSS
ncbi:unnamed protein product [Triticum turgidum subsp. durum]|uniref:Pentatricopeptide repeat-containing protein n=1 Tax=Triticum turgidum subsp. durum TaxID=4567 RepID=A0A9R0WQJ6_TRITD|nr:unnamed protein product [Triticum turgidum subsp. durum]